MEMHLVLWTAYGKQTLLQSKISECQHSRTAVNHKFMDVANGLECCNMRTVSERTCEP
jgi:hypothetical protein